MLTIVPKRLLGAIPVLLVLVLAVFTLQKLRRFRPRLAVIGTGVHNLLPYYEKSLGPVFLSRFDIWSPTMTGEERADVIGRMESAALWRYWDSTRSVTRMYFSSPTSTALTLLPVPRTTMSCGP